MIKKIPIKGISRDPSGQISADGFCAESLNVQLDMGEVAPAIKPKTMKDAGGNDISVDGDILYIHKGIGYENLIYRNGGSLLYVAAIGDASSGVVFDGLADKEINDITSIGNTVIVSSDEMYYILWRDGSYHFLGNQIPIPAIHFRMGNLESLRSVPNVVIDVDNHPSVEDVGGFGRTEDDAIIFPHENIGDVSKYGYSAKKYAFDRDFEKGFWNEFLDVTWGEIDKKVGEQSRIGKAVFPMFVRYAVRLYDGTCYAQSIPVLLGAEISRFVDAKALVLQMFLNVNNEEKHMLTTAMVLADIAGSYSVVMDASNRNIFDGWEDIVTSVDIFVSPQISVLQRNAAKFEMELLKKEDLVNPVVSTMTSYLVRDFFLDPYYTEENQEKLVEYYQTTYLAQSFPIEEFKDLPSDFVLDIDTSSDYIMAQEALKETPQSMHYAKGGNLFNYNKRLLMAGAEQVLHSGYPFLHSVGWKTNSVINPGTAFRFVYYLRGENGENSVICRDENGDTLIRRKKKAVVNESATEYYEDPVAWLAYPDSRCYKIEVYRVEGTNVRMTSYKTNVFDQSDVAYVFLGFGVQIARQNIRVDELPSYENRTYKMQNTLVVSKANNPFVFPAEDSVTFTAGEVMNLAVANVPLSEGQAGQFPLYVFTDEGVYAMTGDAEGKLRTSHNVSRDVLLSRDALVGIEQGVFFSAARGLLLLQGSRVTKVSNMMDGLPDEIQDDGFVSMINARFFADSPIESPKAFSEFISNCFLAYDYANTRILLMNPGYRTMYVYKFDTQSWHRLSFGSSHPVRALNSYPEAQVVIRSSNRQSVVNLSVIAENEDAQPLTGLVYTRDIALDGSDIYKVISKLKVRGRFENGHVRWQLQGSNDGINYTTIHSLRGPSWKWYRLVLLTMLSKNERISYIEVDYDPRFTDTIR